MQLGVSEHCWYLVASIFILFYIAKFEVYHHQHTSIAYVQNTDPEPGIFGLLTQSCFQSKIKRLALYQVTSSVRSFTFIKIS